MLRTLTAAGLLSLCSPSFSGFYLGLGGGPEGAHFNQRAHVTGNSGAMQVGVNQPGAFNVIATNNFSGLGGFGTVFGGYEWFYNLFYLAAELNGTWSSVEYVQTNDEYLHHNFGKTYFNMNTSEGVSLLPGFFLSNTTVLYGRIAYTNGRLKIVEGTDPSIQNITQNLSGIRYGIGIKQELSPQWAFRMDYSQINYNSVNSLTIFPGPGVTKLTKITPNTAQLALGIIYLFDRPIMYSK